MSRTVLNVLEEGIKSVGLENIDKNYEWILNDFYKKCCVIDPKRDYTPKTGKYSEIYRCFNSKRESSTLEVNIDNENIIKVKQFNDHFSNILTITPEPINPIVKRYNLLRVGILTLEKISSVYYEEDITTNLDKLTISSTGGTLESYKDDEVEYYRAFCYNPAINEISFYTDCDLVMTKKTSFEDYVRSMYRKFNINITNKGSF